MSVQYIEVEINEIEPFDIDVVEKEMINVELNCIDIIPYKRNITNLEDTAISNPSDGEVLTYEDGYWVNKPITEAELSSIILNETPLNVNSLPSKRFKVTNAFITNKIIVYLNGMKIHNSEITFHSDTEFSYPIDILNSDMVEVAYIKKG